MSSRSESAATFLQAGRGIWRLTWANQLSGRRLALPLLFVLALPLLVWWVVPSPESWARRQSPFGDPASMLSQLERRLNRAKLPLQLEQRAQLQQMITEEFARTEAELREPGSPSGATDRRVARVRACYQRIQVRAGPVLDDVQTAQLQGWIKRSQQAGVDRAGEPVSHWTAPYYHWLIDFYFFIVLPLLCVQVGGGLIRNELQADTLGFLISRPLSRARLLVLKYLCQSAWLQLLLLLATLFLFAAGGLRQIPGLAGLLPLFLAAQVLAVFAWSALGVLLGQITNRYIVLALVYGAIVELGIGRIPTNLNSLSLLRHLQTLLGRHPGLTSLYEWPDASVPFAVGALLLASGVFLGLAALLFTHLEYHPTAEMQK